MTDYELTEVIRCRSPIGYNATVTPTMSSNTAPSGNVASASNEYTSSYAAWKAFNHSIVNDDAWMTETGEDTGWLQIQLATGCVARKYTIYNRRFDANQDAGGASYAPYDWDLYGSNNGTDWTLLDSQTGITWSLVAQEAKSFEFVNSTSYTYYKLDITANNGGGRVAIGELYIYDEMSDPPISVTASTSITDSIAMSFSRSVDSIVNQLESIITLDTKISQPSKILSDIINVIDLSVPISKVLDEIITIGQVPLVQLSSYLTEQGHEVFGAVSEVGDYVYTNITEAGREVFEYFHEYGLQVNISSQKNEVVELDDFRYSGYEFIIHNFIRFKDYFSQQLFIPLAEILRIMESLPIDARANATIESLSLAGAHQINTMSYALNQIVASDVKRVYPSANILNEVALGNTYNVVVRFAMVAEVINAIDVAVGTMGRYLVETISIIGTKTVTASRALTLETLNVIDTIISSGTNILVEILRVSDTIATTLTSYRTDVIKLEREQVNKNVNSNVPLHIVELPEVLIKSPSIVFAEILNIIDILVPSIAKVMNEAIYLLTPVKLRSQVNKTFAELLNVIDVGKAMATRPLSESITITDTIFIPPFTRVMVEVLSLIGSIPHRVVSTVRVDSIVINDDLLPGIINYIFVEILNVSDALNPMSLLAYLSESLKINGVFSRHVNLVGAEVLNVIDTISNVQIITSLVDEIFNVIDTRMIGVSKPTVETVRVYDSRWRSVQTFKTEAINVIDSFYSQFGILLTEVINFGDSIVKRPAPYMIEKLYFLPLLNRQYSLIFTEAIVIADTLSNVPSYILVEFINLSQSFDTRVTIYKTELVNFVQTIVKRPMKYQALENVAVSDTYRVSALATLIAEALSVVDTTNRTVARYLNELVKILDEKCAKRVSFVARETLAMIDLRNATLDQSLQEVILVSDSIYPSVMLVRLEALLVSNRITRYVLKLPFDEVLIMSDPVLLPTIGRVLEEIMTLGQSMGNTLVEYTLVKEIVITSAERIQKTIVYSAFEEILTITSSIGRHMINISPLVESLIIKSEMGSTTIVLRAFEEVIAIRMTMYKIVHDYLLVLETINVADSPKEWYNNIVHRLESVVKQVTKIRTSSRTDKEKSVKKLTKDSKRE